MTSGRDQDELDLRVRARFGNWTPDLGG